MKILIAYDGSECAEAALDDLQRAGLPQQGVEALVGLKATAIVKEDDPKRVLVADAEQWGADCLQTSLRTIFSGVRF